MRVDARTAIDLGTSERRETNEEESEGSGLYMCLFWRAEEDLRDFEFLDILVIL